MADGYFGQTQIVVDGLGNGDERDIPLLGELAQDMQRAIAAGDDQGIEAQLAIALDHLMAAVDHAAIGHGIGEGIALVGTAQDRAAAAQQLDIGLARRQRDPFHGSNEFSE